jgi:hypothetical protein
VVVVGDEHVVGVVRPEPIHEAESARADVDDQFIGEPQGAAKLPFGSVGLDPPLFGERLKFPVFEELEPRLFVSGLRLDANRRVSVPLERQPAVRC